MKYFIWIIIGGFLMSCSNKSKTNNSSDSVVSVPTENYEETIDSSTLPEKAKVFINDNFGLQIAQLKDRKRPEPSGAFYEVMLSDMTEIDFTQEGDWLEIDGENDAVIPIGYLPMAIRDYLNQNKPKIGVKSVKKTVKEIELDLVSDEELFFDLNGKFIREEK